MVRRERAFRARSFFLPTSTRLARDSARGDLRARPAVDVLANAVSRRDGLVAGVRPAPRPGAARDEGLPAAVLSHDSVLTGVQPMRTPAPGTRQGDSLSVGAQRHDSATAGVQLVPVP